VRNQPFQEHREEWRASQSCVCVCVCVCAYDEVKDIESVSPLHAIFTHEIDPQPAAQGMMRPRREAQKISYRMCKPFSQ